MLPFGNKKLKEKLESYEDELIKKNREVQDLRDRLKQKDKELNRQETELQENRKLYNKYKSETDAKLIKNEEIIEKLGERWDVMENNYIKKEEQQRIWFEQMKTTQEAIIRKMEAENEDKTQIIREHEAKIKTQNEKIVAYEEKIQNANKEIELLKVELDYRNETIGSYGRDSKEFQQKFENMEKEISNLNSKIDIYRTEMENKRKQIEHLYAESNIKTEQVRELEKKIVQLEENNYKLEMEKKEETDKLKTMIDSKKKEVQEKTKQIESLKNKSQLLCDTERDLKELNNQNTSLKKELDEKTKSIKEYKQEVSNKEKRIHDLQSRLEISNKDILTKSNLISSLESKNRSFLNENKNVQEQYAIEKRTNQETITQLKDKVVQNEETLVTLRGEIEQLETKLKKVEQENKELDMKSNMEVQKIISTMKEMEETKDKTIEKLETSEKRVVECLNQKNETIIFLEKEIKNKDQALCNKEEEIVLLKKKIGELLHDNEVLEYKVQQNDGAKDTELDKIGASLREQIKTINGSYQIEWETKQHQTDEFNRQIELFVNKQIGEKEADIKLVDNMQEATEQLISNTNKKIEACTARTREHKAHLDSLQRLLADMEKQNKDIREELKQKNISHEKQRKQMDENFRLLQNEILKSEIGSTLPELSNDIHVTGEGNDVPAMENILRQIHTRNVLMKDLREDMKQKQDIIIRLQEKYQRLSDKIKRVVVTVNNAKFAYQEVEKENRRLKQVLVQKKFICETIDHGMSTMRVCAKTGTTALSEAYSDYDLRIRREGTLSNDKCIISPPLQLLCDELESIKESSRKEILNLNQHTGLEPLGIDYKRLQTEIQKERKLRKKQEALFTSVLNTLRSNTGAVNSAEKPE